VKSDTQETIKHTQNIGAVLGCPAAGPPRRKEGWAILSPSEHAS